MITYVCANNSCCKHYRNQPEECPCGSKSFIRENDEPEFDYKIGTDE